MCGIFGFFSDTKISAAKRNSLKKHSHYLSERGPDYYGEINNSHYFLANSRLKIVSKKDTKVPMYKHNSYIAFSGEILNFNELRKSLKEKGYNFFSDTDTEVILSLYDCYGLDFVKYLKGFFSIAIYDTWKKKLFLIIDRIGNKAIFYHNNKNFLVFSSQQSYLLRSKLLEFNENEKKISEFIVFGDISGKETLHKNIKKMLPGEIIVYDFKNIKISKYYDIKEKILQNSTKKLLSYKETCLKLKKNFTDTVNLWSKNCAYNKSILLSAGIDSGLLAMYLSKKSNKLKSYTANTLNKDSQNFNEYDQAKALIKKYKIDSELVSFEKDDIDKNLDTLYSNFEEPLPSSSFLLYKISTQIKNYNQRICFTGDGADEIFGGYERHKIIKENYDNSNNVKDIIMGLNYLSVARLKKYFNEQFKIPKERISFFDSMISENKYSTLDKILLYDIKFYLPMFLRSTEIIGMKNSIEFRSPFTDHNFIENTFQIKDNYRMNKYANKLILKKIFKMKNQPIIKKKLFSTPFIVTQFRTGFLKEKLQNLNNNSKINKYYPVKKIKKLLESHQKIDHSNTLFRLLTLNSFLESK